MLRAPCFRLTHGSFPAGTSMRDRLFLLTILLSAPAVAHAQLFPRESETARVWFVISDGMGPSGGGLSGATGLSQLYRASGTVAVSQNYGVEVSGLRIQEIY